jgi:secreted trypsin-like serine protease
VARYPGYQTIKTRYGQILEGDVALLELDKPLMTATVGVVNVPDPTIEPTLLKTKIGTISGWGKSTTAASALSDPLQYGTVKIASDQLCTNAYGNGILRNDMVCANALPQDVCSGDSGGPLVMKTGQANSNVSYVEGIVSWTYPPGGCPSTKPSVYARVSAFYKWIDDCVKGKNCPSSIPASP